MKIALIQTNPQSNFNDNLKNAKEYIFRAAHTGTNVIICPETFLFMGTPSERKKFGNRMNDGVFFELQELAAQLHIYLIAGSVDEIIPSSQNLTAEPSIEDMDPAVKPRDDKHKARDDKHKPRDDGKFYNTCLTFDPTGKIISQYRKYHLFNLFDENGKPTYCESDVYESGTIPNTYELRLQNEIWTALNIICYDIRFPEIIRHRNQPCDVIFVPAAFTWQTGIDHWEILLRARAIENQCFVVACNQTGYFNQNEKRNFGHSMIIDPWGKIIAQLGEEEGILYCEISKSDILKSRAKLPALQDRKIFGDYKIN